ncbi:uncharacterized protein LOC135683789 isoform X2 [Rhopilema esculentum]|uniref:uncharacterized protein LOC135683789 isoform X2 n=1 Tax=Rhopilema esculentum TaxID=499914 RepID=UPI0031D684F6
MTSLQYVHHVHTRACKLLQLPRNRRQTASRRRQICTFTKRSLYIITKLQVFINSSTAIVESRVIQLTMYACFVFLGSLLYTQALLVDDFETSPLFVSREAKIEKRIRKEEIECNDNGEANCGYFVKWNLCKVYKQFLRRKCRKSCGMCGHENCAYSLYGCCWDRKTPATGPNGIGCPRNCHNRLGTHRCTLLKILGGCYRFQELMFDKCYGVCFCDWENTFTTDCPESKYGCCWDGFSPADENQETCPICRDYLPKRICEEFRTLCGAYGYLSGWQMRKACAETCGICTNFNQLSLSRYTEALVKTS